MANNPKSPLCTEPASPPNRTSPTAARCVALRAQKDQSTPTAGGRDPWRKGTRPPSPGRWWPEADNTAVHPSPVRIDHTHMTHLPARGIPAIPPVRRGRSRHAAPRADSKDCRGNRCVFASIHANAFSCRSIIFW